MIRASWKSLAAILVWATLIPVWGFWMLAAWRRLQQQREDRARRGTCRLCWAEFEWESALETCPRCGTRTAANRSQADGVELGEGRG